MVIAHWDACCYLVIGTRSAMQLILTVWQSVLLCTPAMYFLMQENATSSPMWRCYASTCQMLMAFSEPVWAVQFWTNYSP